jgi:integrase
MAKTTISKSNNLVLRKRKIKSGYSLYLDIHVNGKRYKENLELYISDNKRLSEEEKETLLLAERIKARRILELRAEKFNDKSILPKPKDFLLFMENTAKQGNRKYSTVLKWNSIIHLLEQYSNGGVSFQEINNTWLEKFKTYLLQSLKRNTADTYFAIVKGVLNIAVKEEIIPFNPMNKVDRIGRSKTLPKFLTLDEIILLDKTACDDEFLKKAFLFCCFTGLRFADTKNLKWKQIIEDRGKLFISFEQKKTESEELLPISEQALKYLGPKGEPETNVFVLGSNLTTNKRLRKWAKKAGLNKNITYHVSRHTFGTLLISSGVDLYIASKLLGHSDIRNTQIYARVIDKKKDEAVDLLPKFD